MKDTRHKRPHTIPLTHETESKLLVFQGAFPPLPPHDTEGRTESESEEYRISLRDDGAENVLTTVTSYTLKW